VTLSALDDEDLRVCDLMNEQRKQTNASGHKSHAVASFDNTSLRLPPHCPPRSLEI
jgi:hypothetical protein